MKASIALCALSVSSWTLAAPIVMLFKHAPPAYSGPQITPTDTWPVRTFKFAVGQETSSQDVLDGRPDNRPYSPSRDVAPSAALAAPRPLHTSYLLSLKPFAVHTEDKAATSQPNYQESSTVKEETGSITTHQPTTVELETEGNMAFFHKIPCTMHHGHFHLARQYADMTVVSIVLILIAVIALVELWDPICRLSSRIWYGEGRIRLEDDVDEKEQRRLRYSGFTLQPAPKPKSRSSTVSETPAAVL